MRLDKWIPFNFNLASAINNLNLNNIPNNSSSSLNNINPNSSSGTTSIVKRLQFGVALINHNLYIVGGRDGLKTLNTVDCFDIQKESWTSLPQMITHRHGLQAAFLGTDSVLYAVGGHDGWSFLNSVERFDLDSKTWNYVASMSNARSTLGVSVIGNILYAVGGRDANVCLNSVEQFNPLTNKWTQCAPMYKKRGAVAVTSLNGFIYAIGGHEATSTLANSNRYECGERYDPKIDQWTIINTISRPREAIAATSLGHNSIFIAGGYDGHKYLSECEKYDPFKNEWAKVQIFSLNYFTLSILLIIIY